MIYCTYKELKMTRCYFDMFDVCQSYDCGNLKVDSGSENDLVDSGIYELPFGYNPIDKTAVQLYIYAQRENECYGK